MFRKDQGFPQPRLGSAVVFKEVEYPCMIDLINKGAKKPKKITGIL
jgi:hypothetical protein